MADDPEKSKKELEKQLAALAERATEQGEGLSDHPRGALPALFRAARATPDEAERARVVALLAARLPDLPLVEPTLELAREGLEGPFAAAVREQGAPSDAWTVARQAATLERVAGEPARFVALLTSLVTDWRWDPTALALDVGVAPLCDALREVVRLRLQAPTRRRDRTSALVARGALRALVRMTADDPALHATLAQVVAAETRRAGKDEPTLALEAVEGLAAAPPFARLRLLGPLLRTVDRPKVVSRLEAAMEAAAREAGVGPEELAELGARTGGLEAASGSSRARVALDDGEARLWIDVSGQVAREPAGTLPGADARAVEAGVRELEAARADLIRRLEGAMVSGRSWTVAMWRAVFQGEHPLWAELAPRVLWELRAPGRPERPFALGPGGAEDLFGERVDLDAGPGARVGLVHPVRLPDEELELWRERALELAVAGERRLVSPFPQLYRRVLAPTQDPTGALARFVGREAHKQTLGDLARDSGWKGFPLQGSSPWDLERVFAGAAARARLVVEDVPLETKKVVGVTRRATRSDDDDDDTPSEKARRRRQQKRPPPAEAAPRVRIAAIELQVEPDVDVRVALAETVLDLEELTDPLATVDELFLRTWQHRKWKDEKEAWREVVLRYRQGSPGKVAVRKALLGALARRAKLTLRLEDRFAIAGTRVVELGTGLVHQGALKEHLPSWKVEEELGDRLEDAPAGLPFEPAADPDTVEVVARVLALARP